MGSAAFVAIAHLRSATDWRHIGRNTRLTPISKLAEYDEINAISVRSPNKIEVLTTFGEAQVPNTPAEDSTTEEAALEKPRGHPSGTEFLQGHYPF